MSKGNVSCCCRSAWCSAKENINNYDFLTRMDGRFRRYQKEEGFRHRPPWQQNITLYTPEGCSSLDWGMQSRLAHFNPHSNRTMLAFDHGYFQGQRPGLYRPVDCAAVCRHRRADAHPRRTAQPGTDGTTNKPVVLRASGGNSILSELSNECVAVAMEDALRSTRWRRRSIGSEYEHQSINNIIKLVDAGNRYGMPVLAVTGVGKEMTRDARYCYQPDCRRNNEAVSEDLSLRKALKK